MPAISQGELELVRFNTTEILREIQRTLFPKLVSHVSCNYGRIPTLGCVNRVGDDRPNHLVHRTVTRPPAPLRM